MDLCSRPAPLRSPSVLQGEEDRPGVELPHLLIGQFWQFNKSALASSDRASTGSDTWWAIRKYLSLSSLHSSFRGEHSRISRLGRWAVWGRGAIIAGVPQGRHPPPKHCKAPGTKPVLHEVWGWIPKKERNCLFKSNIIIYTNIVISTWEAQILLCWKKLVGDVGFLIPVNPSCKTMQGKWEYCKESLYCRTEFGRLAPKRFPPLSLTCNEAVLPAEHSSVLDVD